LQTLSKLKSKNDLHKFVAFVEEEFNRRKKHSIILAKICIFFLLYSKFLNFHYQKISFSRIKWNIIYIILIYIILRIMQ